MITETRSIHKLAQAVTAGIEFGEPLDLRFGQCGIRIRTNDHDVADRLRHYFRAFVESVDAPEYEIIAIQIAPPDLSLRFEDWPRDPGKIGRKDLICDISGGRVVRKARTGMQFLVSADTKIAFGDCRTNDNQVINFVISQFMAWLRGQGWEICHAAGIVFGDMGIAISAASGGGKSTLALHMMSHGAKFVSNDRLLIAQCDGAARMAGVPKMPRVNPGTLLNNADLVGILLEDRRRALKALNREELWGLEEKYDVDVEECFGKNRQVMEAQLSAFIVLNWDRTSDAPFCLRPVNLAERPDLLDPIMKPPGPFVLGTGGDVPRTVFDLDRNSYSHRLRGVKILEATGVVDFDAACSAIINADF